MGEERNVWKEAHVTGGVPVGVDWGNAVLERRSKWRGTPGSGGIEFTVGVTHVAWNGRWPVICVYVRYWES